VLLRRVPGGLALSVTMMGIVMAASTGIIGASVVMMSLLALPDFPSPAAIPRPPALAIMAA
jgi:TRAP-type mannitol/chloroaromatic compound transport system permease large subunit